jgi:hypothetical protein
MLEFLVDVAILFFGSMGIGLLIEKATRDI